MSSTKENPAKATQEVTIITNDSNALHLASQSKADFPHHTRLVSIDGNVLDAMSVAYKTASGLHCTAQGQITKCIYNMSKIDLATLIVKNDDSDYALERAASEIARDAFVSGNLEGKASVLAAASGRSRETCRELISKKLIKLTDEMNARSNPLNTTVEVPASPEAICESIMTNGGKYLLNLPTAYGKTSKILEPVIQSYLNAGKKVLLITHRRSINKNIANIKGMVSYDECVRPSVIEGAQGLKIVVNSIANNQFKAFVEAADLVVIDEATQVISHVLGGEVRDRQAVWNTLDFVVKNAQNVVMSDADIDSRCAEMIGEAKVFSIKQNHSRIKVATAGIDQVRAIAVAAATSTNKPRNVLIACDAVKEANALAKVIEKKNGQAPLVITAETAKWPEQAAFIANPNTTAHKVVIYSPVITSALSITSGHFSAHFGLFQGHVVPKDAIQMLRRNRTASLFVVGIKASAYSKSEVVEVAFKKERAMVDQALCSLNIDDETKTKVRAAVYAETALTGFKAVEYKHCSDEAWLKDHIQNTLPATLLAQGFRVRVMGFDEHLNRAGSIVDSQGRKAFNKAMTSKLLSAKSASKATMHRVKDAGSADEAEFLAVTRSRAEAVMSVQEFTEADAKLWGQGEGESKIRKFRQLFSGVVYETSNQPDVLDRIRDAVNSMSETNTWSGQSSIVLYDQLNAMRTDVIAMGIKISSAKSDQAKQADISKILAQFGLRTKKRETTRSAEGQKIYFYTVTAESLAQMTRYI